MEPPRAALPADVPSLRDDNPEAAGEPSREKDPPADPAPDGAAETRHRGEWLMSEHGPTICQMIGEPYSQAFYTDCQRCSKRTCPVKHLLERIDKLEDLVYQLEAVA